MTHYGEWKIWNGGECPVDPETMVQCQCADDTRETAEASGSYKASKCGWSYDPNGSCLFHHRIIAYREVIEPRIVEQTAWAQGYSHCAPNLFESPHGDMVRGTVTQTFHGDKIAKIVWEPDQ